MSHTSPPKQNKLTDESGSSDLLGELHMNDYVQEVVPSQRTTEHINAWANAKLNQQQEKTRSRLAILLVAMFCGTIIVSYILVGSAALIPSADKTLVKDITAQMITPQAALLGAALGYYFGSKKN